VLPRLLRNSVGEFTASLPAQALAARREDSVHQGQRFLANGYDALFVAFPMQRMQPNRRPDPSRAGR